MAAAAAGDLDAVEASKIYNSTPPDAPARMVAFNHKGSSAALAFGRKLAVVVAGSTSPVDLGESAMHSGTIRALIFDPTGAWLLTADDSKACSLRRTSDWTVIHTFKTTKKPTTAVFGSNGCHVFVADKFGDVTVAATSGGPSALLLGHYCSTVAALAVSPDGRLLASADRDNKVRVSVLPRQPLQGAHEIQSYCLGHTSFVTCAAFVSCDSLAALVTAGGDGSLRLWNHVTGQQLAVVQLTERLPNGAEGNAAIQSAVNAAASAAASFGKEAPRNPPLTAGPCQKQTASKQGPLEHSNDTSAPEAAGGKLPGSSERDGVNQPDRVAVTSAPQDVVPAVSLVASADGVVAAVDEGQVAEGAMAMGGAVVAGPADGESAAAATAGGPPAVSAAAGCEDLGQAAAQATAAAAEANSIAIAADDALAPNSPVSSTPAGAPTPASKPGEESGTRGPKMPGDDDDDDDDDGSDRHSAPKYRSILSVSAHGRQLAVAVEGQNEVVILAVHLDPPDSDAGGKQLRGSIKEVATVILPEVILPSQVAHDEKGRLWAVGGAVQGEAARRFNIASSPSPSDEQGGETAAASNTNPLAAALQEAATVCQLSDSDATAAAAARKALGGQVSEHLKNRQQCDERQQRSEQYNSTRLDKRLKMATSSAVGASTAASH